MKHTVQTLFIALLAVALIGVSGAPTPVAQ